MKKLNSALVGSIKAFSSSRRDSRDGSDSDTGSVRSGLTVSSGGSEDGAARGRPLPLFAFGSARYGMLGPVEPDLLECEPSDYFERYSPTLRYVEGYAGGSISDIQAGGNHLSVLIDFDVEKGGKLLSHGLATYGRLGIGNERRDVKNRWIPKSSSKERKNTEKSSQDEDFSALPYETAELPYGTIVSDRRARYANRPKKVKMGKVKQISCGQTHTVALNAKGQIWVWGTARHGRLGIGSSAYDGSLPCDAEDQFDTYLSMPTPVEVFGVVIACVAAGHKHSLACDISGVCYAWGLARYGRLGIEQFEQLSTEPPDVRGNQDIYSWYQPTPTIITSLQGVSITGVFAGAYNSYAIAGGNKNDLAARGGPTTVYAWGLARYGLLGVGDCPATCCFETKFDPSVGPEQCPRCKRTQLPAASGEFASFVEEARGHPNFSRLKVSRPKCPAEMVTLSHDREDLFDTYIPFPIEVTTFQAQSIARIFPGTFHVLALTERGALFSWGLLRHGRCGHGKFDPDSSWSESIGRAVHDRDVPAYPREVVFDVTVRGAMKVRVSDPVSWYQPTPKLIEGLSGKQVISASAAECHSAAITQNGSLFTWGVARHGRLGTFDPAASLLVDSQDPDGRYRASPAPVLLTGPDPLAPKMMPVMVACMSATTFVVGQDLPEWVRNMLKLNSKKGSIFRRFSKGQVNSGDSDTDTAGDSRSRNAGSSFRERLKSLPQKLKSRMSSRALSEGSGESSSPRSEAEGNIGRTPSEPESITIEDDYGNLIVVPKKSRRGSVASEDEGNKKDDGVPIRRQVLNLINSNRLLQVMRRSNSSPSQPGSSKHVDQGKDESDPNQSDDEGLSKGKGRGGAMSSMCQIV